MNKRRSRERRQPHARTRQHRTHTVDCLTPEPEKRYVTSQHRATAVLWSRKRAAKATLECHMTSINGSRDGRAVHHSIGRKQTHSCSKAHSIPAHSSNNISSTPPPPSSPHLGVTPRPERRLRRGGAGPAAEARTARTRNPGDRCRRRCRPSAASTTGVPQGVALPPLGSASKIPALARGPAGAPAERASVPAVLSAKRHGPKRNAKKKKEKKTGLGGKRGDKNDQAEE